MCRFYEIKCMGDDKVWEEDSEQEGCCEDSYDDDEEYEKEWCD